MQKPLLTIVIHTVHGDTFTITDTVECGAASLALDAIKHGEPVIVPVDGDNYLVVAVDHVQITTETSEEYTRPDPVCPGEEEECVFAFSETVTIEDSETPLQYIGELGAVITVTYDGVTYEDVVGVLQNGDDPHIEYREDSHGINTPFGIFSSSEDGWTVVGEEGEHTITVCSENVECTMSVSETVTTALVNEVYVGNLSYDGYLSEYIDVTINGVKYEDVVFDTDAYDVASGLFLLQTEGGWVLVTTEEGEYNISICAKGLLISGGGIK